MDLAEQTTAGDASTPPASSDADTRAQGFEGPEELAAASPEMELRWAGAGRLR